ncbi:hypothetical protein H8N03_00585 [Ramlibacter sp. USB13]|uniref:Uncharacterized protein n=1 Tax=Ramlibacter cellulosilyticus TaxID=2764187 RepID=A0A923MMC7_9BURK|nr:hypothetical protein [Ramlibacter cellulosilyticus]
MSRDVELLYLAQADEHVRHAKEGIARQQRWVDLHARDDPDELLRGQRLLQAMRETLGELLVHRDGIVQRLGSP